MSFINPKFSVAAPVSSMPLPSWMPLVGTNTPVMYADFTTEGTTNHYWYNPIQATNYSNYQRASFTVWLAAVSGTFSRSSTAYYTNSSGNLTQAPNGQIRFDYDPIALTSKGVLLEGSSTNIVLQSNTFTATWSALNISDAQNATGPDGVLNSAWTITSSAGGGVSQHTQSVTTGSTNTVSFWFKNGTTGFVYIQLNNANGAVEQFFNLSAGTLGTTTSGAALPVLSNPQIVQQANGWFRCSVTADSTVNLIVFGPCDADASRNSSTSKTLLAWGAQCELQSFASSYIPTTTVTVTRAADSLSVPWTRTTFTALIGTKLTAEQDNNRIIDAGNGLLFQGAGPVVDTSNGAQTLNVAVNAWTSANILGVAGTPGGRVLSANGNAAATDSNALVPSAPAKVQIGSDTSNANNATGGFSQFGLWNVTATAAQLQALT